MDCGYVITKAITNFRIQPILRTAAGARVGKIPAPLACQWLGLLEVEADDDPQGS